MPTLSTLPGAENEIPPVTGIPAYGFQPAATWYISVLRPLAAGTTCHWSADGCALARLTAACPLQVASNSARGLTVSRLFVISASSTRTVPLVVDQVVCG